MNVISVSGGLGNQLFDYVFGLLFKNIRYDVSWLINNPKIRFDTVRRFRLSSFNIPIDNRFGIVKNYNSFKTIRERWSGYYQPELLKLDNVYIFGYFQCYQYVLPNKDLILKQFILKDEPQDTNYQNLLNNIRNSNSVSIHIRRSDYLKHRELYRILDVDYYKKAYDIIQSKVSDTKYFIFSEDRDWCKQNLSFIKNAVIVNTSSYNREELDMILMSNCKHNIIANSTYSWWSAFLNQNPNKIVISPKQWFVNIDDSKDRLPPNWITL